MWLQLLGVDVHHREFITLRWHDGKRSKFHLLHLRTWCQCSDCVHSTGQRVVNCSDIKQDELDFKQLFGTCCLDTDLLFMDLRAVSIKTAICLIHYCAVKGDILNIVWNDRHKSSFSCKWLLQNSYSDWALDQHAHNMATTPLAVDAPIPSTEYNRMMDTSDDKGLYEALHQVIEHGLTVIRNTPLRPGAVKALAERIAPISHSYVAIKTSFIDAHAPQSSFTFTQVPVWRCF